MTNIMAFVLTHWEITLVPVILDSLEMVSAAVVSHHCYHCMRCAIYDVNVVDVDECLNGGDDCESRNAECDNTIGSFDCYCRDGYRYNGSYCDSTD